MPSLARSSASGRMPTTTSAMPAAAAASPAVRETATSVPPSETRAVRPAGHREEVHRRRPDEARHERVRRAVVEHARGVALLQQAVLQHRDAVAERHRLGLVVRDVDRRRGEPRLQLGDVGAHLDAQLGIEVRERLVHQVDARLAHDRPPHRHPLALSARQLPGLALEELGQPEQRGDLAHARLALGLRHLRDLQREGDVGGHGEVRIERVVLEHHRDVALLRGDVGDVAVADHDRAGVDLLEAGEHAQRGRLARARRADEDDELAVGDVEVERIDRGGRRAGIDARRCHETDVGHHSTSR